MVLEETARLDVPPGPVMAFLESMEVNYLHWHPGHLAFRWIDPPNTALRRFFFDERIGAWRLRMTMTMARSAGGNLATCRPTSPFWRTVMPWMTFAVTPEADGCRYTHRIRLRTGPLGFLLRPLILDAVQRHMREESANLRRLITPH